MLLSNKNRLGVIFKNLIHRMKLRPRDDRWIGNLYEVHVLVKSMDPISTSTKPTKFQNVVLTFK